MAERFLILGAKSYYGSQFAILMREKGHEVIELFRPDWTIGDPLPCEAEYIVNFAAKNIVQDSWGDADGYADVNVVKTTRLFDQLKTLKGLKKFVQCSTPEVYGSTEGWIDETYRFNPSTPYAVTRAAADMMLLAYQRAYKIPAVITRTANIYGPTQPDFRIIPLAIKKLKADQQVQMHGDGRSIRCFIHVRDACEGIYLAAKHGAPGHTYHSSTNRPVSIADLLRMICNMVGKRFDQLVVPAPDRTGKDHAYLLKSHVLRNMGWKDKIGLEKGLLECVSLILA